MNKPQKSITIHSSHKVTKESTAVKKPRRSSNPPEILLTSSQFVSSRNIRKDAFGNAITKDIKGHKVSFKDTLSNGNLVEVSNISTEREHKICFSSKNNKYDSPKIYNQLLAKRLEEYREQNKDFFFERVNTMKHRRERNRNALKIERSSCCHSSCLIF